jgi:hypothetical protein
MYFTIVHNLCLVESMVAENLHVKLDGYTALTLISVEQVIGKCFYIYYFNPQDTREDTCYDHFHTWDKCHIAIKEQIRIQILISFP